MRVVSLTCSNTEIVSALGCADLLVGVDDHSDYPADVVSRLPRVGPDLGVDIQKVANLKPDLVLASLTVPGHEKIVDQLEQAGLHFIAPEPISLNDIYTDIETIGIAIGAASKAEQIVVNMRRELEDSDATADAVIPENTPSILIQWWPKPVIAPGRQSWIHDLIKLSGATHPLMGEDVKSRPLEDAEVAALNPDIIVMSWCGVKTEKYRADVVYRNPAFKNIKAIKQKRILPVPEAWLGRPSPRLVNGYKALRKIVEENRNL